MTLRVGITCYPTFGGSGIVATEIGLAMAARGHTVHFICTDLPARLPHDVPGVTLHRVIPREYPVFPAVPYGLALTSAMVDVARREGLDLFHAHYAVPHATSAWMARQVLGPGAPPLITTLHGTDITLVGSDPSYLPITRHAIAHSDAVTAPSAFLAEATWDNFGLDPAQTPIEVIPNFVDGTVFRPAAGPDRPRLQAIFPDLGPDEPVLVHVSNFRPVKRVDRVHAVFERVAAHRPARLLLIGPGSDLSARVKTVVDPPDLEAIVRECTAFLLPSDTESFGLAALEAMASGVPVVASDVGGLPEVIRDGETGWLCAPDDLDGMAARVAALFDDPALRARMGAAARADAVARFAQEPLVARYEALYERVVATTR